MVPLECTASWDEEAPFHGPKCINLHQWEAGSDGVTGSAVEEKAGFLPRTAAGRGRAPRGDERLLEGTLCLNEPLPTLPRPHPLLPEEQPGRKASLGGARARAGSDRAAEELRAVETHRRHSALPCGSAGEPLAPSPEEVPCPQQSPT
ncbi:hypothetical protein NDU88_003427 [Pleurodeles waltl]|uniref:Uncharacterized protein n=1 Tax=Pleurodeles waltl TaxID=8319 RepID=A0AAV7VDA6_PLEWA|nr:hypothetical protein NDU88_003427 [Pleurodeles waltl]